MKDYWIAKNIFETGKRCFSYEKSRQLDLSKHAIFYTYKIHRIQIIIIYYYYYILILRNYK